MSLSDNLKAAKAALKHIESLNLLSSNKLSDRLASAGGIEKVIGTDQGKRTEKWGPAGSGLVKVRKQLRNDPKLKSLRNQVKFVKKNRYANCGELADIAFLYVYDNYPSIHPLDAMLFSNETEDAKGRPLYDHAWLMIGLDPKFQSKDMKSWGADAVWCDPWQSGGKAFSISDFIAGKVRNLNPFYLCDSVQRVQTGLPESYRNES